MRKAYSVASTSIALLLVANACNAQTQPKPQAQGASQEKPFEPQVGQGGKDVVWVPTPDSLVETMLNMAQVTAKDYVIDLGSGDGRTVIAAAKRGATAMGIEYDPNMVALSKDNASKAGVASRATFVKADLFESDFSKAQVITMFLLPTINIKLRPKLLDMKPGTRIVSNSFDMEDWQPDDRQQVTDGCTSWCTALLWIVPAKVDGSWKHAKGDLKLTQQYQMLTGTLAGQSLSGSMKGDEISFTIGDKTYTGKLEGGTLRGTGPDGPWTATR